MTLSTKKFTRRSLLVRGGQLGALGLLASRLHPLLAATAERGFPIGATDWTLDRRGDPGVFAFAKEIGLNGVQISVNTQKDHVHLFAPAMQKTYLEASRATGVKIASLGLGELNRVPLKNDPRAAKWAYDSVDVAKALGVDIVLLPWFFDAEFQIDDKAALDVVVPALKAACAHAEKQGVTLGLENYMSGKDNLKIIDLVGSPALKVYYDVGNSTFKGYDILKEIRMLGDLICQVHAKDAKNRLGQGTIDFHEVRKALDDIGYQGWIVIESPRPDGAKADYATDPTGLLTDYRADLAYLRTIFPAPV